MIVLQARVGRLDSSYKTRAEQDFHTTART